MAGQPDPNQIHEEAKKAEEYFSELPGFHSAAAEEPPPTEAEEEVPPETPAVQLSEAEKYFQGLIDK